MGSGMIVMLIFLVFVVGLCSGALAGMVVAGERTRDALKLARYRDAIALCDDLIKTPDALDLRPRAQKILAAHRAATNVREP